mgnify:CR=1 FL=1
MPSHPLRTDVTVAIITIRKRFSLKLNAFTFVAAHSKEMFTIWFFIATTLLVACTVGVVPLCIKRRKHQRHPRNLRKKMKIVIYSQITNPYILFERVIWFSSAENQAYWLFFVFFLLSLKNSLCSYDQGSWYSIQVWIMLLTSNCFGCMFCDDVMF